MKIAGGLVAASLIAATAFAADAGPLPEAVTFSTLITTPEAIEGLTGDDRGNLYVGTRFSTTRCKVYRINIDKPALVVVGTIPAPPGGQCSSVAILSDAGLAVSGECLWAPQAARHRPQTVQQCS